MATSQTKTDDIDGTEGATTRYFGINDKSLEIDLTDANFAKLTRLSGRSSRRPGRGSTISAFPDRKTVRHTDWCTQTRHQY